jgi:glycosyltransferase involved in cell wall biosynthesis
VRVAIASRIFNPEPSAASFRLEALARAFADHGHDVTVFTSTIPRERRGEAASFAQRTAWMRVRRFPVVRNRSGYVRGYVPYLSFDIPLFFRLLCSRRFDVIITEPPPTTGAVVRLVAGLRRAAQQTASAAFVVRAVRIVERWALRGASAVLSVSDGVTARLAALGASDRALTIGNGIDVEAFNFTGETESDEDPLFVYAGTSSEWHGSGIFVEAFAEVLRELPEARLLFIGGGSERDELEQKARRIGIEGSVDFRPSVAPAQLAEILRRSTASLASQRPEVGYDYAFPTKLYASAACGTPLIFAGSGPAVEFVASEVDGTPIGRAAAYTPAAVSESMIETVRHAASRDRRLAVAKWARNQVAISRPAELAVRRAEELLS